MIRPTFKTALVLLALSGCSQAERDGQSEPSPGLAQALADRPKLGLMTSLPLYWPLGADFADLASGNAPVPWQRRLIEARFQLVPLDTLSPIAGLSSNDPEIDPLEGLERLAVIQPRGLSPADNVALDDWVRAGGELLLVLDPALTGEYDAALGDPRRPADMALIPPVVARWGLEVVFDETQDLTRRVELREPGPRQSPPLPLARPQSLAVSLPQSLAVSLAGEIRTLKNAGGTCELLAESVIARCAIGKGTVTLLADASVFEDEIIIARDNTGEQQPVVRLLRFVFP
jgi:hypothetical protein